MNKKSLVILNGVTGAIGTATLARLSREHGIDIFGLSRKAIRYEDLCVNNFLNGNILIFSIGDITKKEDCQKFVEKINKDLYENIIYIHAVGYYPFELNDKGEIEVSHDEDQDGIDDRVKNLSYDAFFNMVDSLSTLGLPVKSLIFGGIADKYKPLAHKSWWVVMDMVKAKMAEELQNDPKKVFYILNISSVICPNEILIRPFVFQKTNAEARFWLKPSEVAEEVVNLIFSERTGLVEDELFHKAQYYEEDYFSEEKFKKRKLKELGIKEE